MNITYRIDKDILYISIDGRIDAANAADAEKAIYDIRQENSGKHTVIDADYLEYISSAGLRIMLKIRKEEPKLAIINVSPDVYDIFDTTGFTDIITVEKAYKRISIEGCEFIAKGANGAVYRYDDETIVKTYFSKDALPDIQQERDSARKAFVLGINTAIPYGIVRVGEGYGTVTELLAPVNVTRLVCDDPENLEMPVKYYVDLLKSIHAVEAEEGDFPDMKEIALGWARFVVNYLPKEQGDKLLSLIEALPKSNILLHGDYHTNNIMIQNGEPLLIDLDTLCVGHPIFEMGSMYNAFLGFSELDHSAIERFMGYDRKTSERFWRMALKGYLNTEDDERVDEVSDKARIIGYMRLMRRAIRRPEEKDSELQTAYYKKKLMELIDRIDTLDF